jgi:hypothetical protein
VTQEEQELEAPRLIGLVLPWKQTEVEEAAPKVLKNSERKEQPVHVVIYTSDPDNVDPDRVQVALEAHGYYVESVVVVEG